MHNAMRTWLLSVHSSTSVPWQLLLVTQHFSHTLMQVLQARRIDTHNHVQGSCMQHGVLICRSIPWRRLRMESLWRRTPS